MTERAEQESSMGLPLPEQDFVDDAYERLDTLRASYRARQGRVHSTHGVGNAQGWTEREALSAHLGEMAARLEGVEERLVFGRLDMADRSVHHVGRLSLAREDGSWWTGVPPPPNRFTRRLRPNRTGSSGAATFRPASAA